MPKIKLYKEIITTKNFILINNLSYDSYLTQSFLISCLKNNIVVLDIIRYIKFYNLIKHVVNKIYQQGGSILFVNNKIFKDLSNFYTQLPRCFYLNDKWKGGMLTNFQTMKKQLDKLKSVDLKSNILNNLINKREKNKLKKKEDQLRKSYEGLKHMKSLPNIIFLLSREKIHVALNECFILGIIPISIVATYKSKHKSPYYIHGDKYSISLVIKGILSTLIN